MSKNDISILGSEVIINGNIINNGAIDICGKFTGTIVSESISIKNGGSVSGKVYTKELIISCNGIVNGEIFANKIKILKNAEVSGDVFYNCISIEDGSKIFGKYENTQEENIEDLINKARENIINKE